MIAALFRRIRSRRARSQIRWGIGYMRDCYGDSGERERQALAAWERYRP